MEDCRLDIRCVKCDGSGLQERTLIIPCSKCSVKTGCMYCQNTNKGMYEECDECRGTGERMRILPDVPPNHMKD